MNTNRGHTSIPATTLQEEVTYNHDDDSSGMRKQVVRMLRRTTMIAILPIKGRADSLEEAHMIEFPLNLQDVQL